MINNMKRTSWVALLLAVLPAVAYAGAEGRLSGTIVGEDGKGVAGVEVSLIQIESGKSEVKETNKKGRFSFLVVDSTAKFGIRMVKSGYITIQEGIDIQAGGTMRQEWVMKQGSALEAPAGAAPDAPPIGTPDAIKVYNEAATAYNAGDRAMAIDKFNEAIGLDPTMAAAYKAVSEVYLAEDNHDAAIEAAKKYLELEPESADSISLMYDALNAAGRGAEGAALLDQLVEKDPSPATAVRLFNMALDSSKKGDFDGALAGFSRALQIDPSLGQGHLGLADSYLRLGRYEEALAAAAKAEEVLPDNIGVQLVQYQSHHRMGNVEAARAAFATVRERSPDRAAQVLFDEGKALFEANELGEAMPRFEAVLEIDDGHPDATYMLGLCKLNQNEIAEAKPLLERFIELAPNHPDAATAKEMLAAL